MFCSSVGIIPSMEGIVCGDFFTVVCGVDRGSAKLYVPSVEGVRVLWMKA